MNAAALLQQNLQKSIDAKRKLSSSPSEQVVFNNAADAVIDSYKNDGRIYIAGNGGSAADAQHLAAEFVSKLARDRAPLPAEALTVDSSILTEIGNDYGYENIFSRQIEAKMSPKDIFLGFTTSGDSKNILNALDVCRNRSITSIIFTGLNGGKAKDRADFCIIAPGDSTAIIQEVHILLAHTLCEYVEKILTTECSR